MALEFLKSKILPPPKPNNAPRAVVYTSQHVDIPADFLRSPPTHPIILTPVPFASSPLPEYDGCFAVTLDNALSQEECDQLIRLAEASVPLTEEKPLPWQPAMVALGPGVEAPAPGYRESDRIIWNQQDVVDRIWERCVQADGLAEQLAVVEEEEDRVFGIPKWEFRRINQRMRFLKYSSGQYFKPHCDGPYWYEEDGKDFQTHYTVHLYLNDSAAVNPQSTLVGGATAFLSKDRKRRLDIDPKAGSVLIFQHRRLLHEGAKVEQGVKFTVRTDVLYEWVNKKKRTQDQGL